MNHMTWYICLSERPDCRYVYSVSPNGKVGNRQHIKLSKLTRWIEEQRNYGRIVVDLIVKEAVKGA